MTRVSFEDFISRAKKRHGERYDYSRVKFDGVLKKCEIGCNRHGFFWQTPSQHMMGKGCQICGGSKKLTTKEFVDRAEEAHGKRYDYAKSVYLRSSEKLVITCRSHGDFYQTPKNHLMGRGCRKCYYSKIGERCRTGTLEFIERAKKQHGEKYSYSKVDYVSGKEKVLIECHDHGFFYQTPGSHLSGSGCPLCPKRYSNPTYVYVMESSTGKSKIGVAIDPIYRARILGYKSPFCVSLYSFQIFPNYREARRAEANIHRGIKDYNCGYSGFEGSSEWFSISPAKASEMLRREHGYAQTG